MLCIAQLDDQVLLIPFKLNELIRRLVEPANWLLSWAAKIDNF